METIPLLVPQVLLLLLLPVVLSGCGSLCCMLPQLRVPSGGPLGQGAPHQCGLPVTLVYAVDMIATQV